MLLRQVPPALAAGVESGSFQVYGSIIRELSTGRIVGHLQEAGGLADLAGLVGSGPAAPLRLIADGFQIVQNEQIKAGIQGLSAAINTVQQLGIANLALGAAGVGISVVGFAVMSRKIDGVKAAVEGLGAGVEAVSRKLDAAQHDVVARELDQLRALAWLAEEGWRNSGSLGERRWNKVSEDAPGLAATFERRAAGLLADGASALPVAEPMLDALALTGSLRVTSLAAMGETKAARSAAAEHAATLLQLTGRIGLADLARATMSGWTVEPGTPAWGHALDRATENARAVAQRLREREAAAATRAAPLAALEAKGIHARDWFIAAREEKSAAVLVMEP